MEMLPIALWSTRPQTLAALAIRFCAGDLCVLCNRHWRGRALVACDRPSQCPRAWSSSPFVPKQHATTADPCVKSWRYFDKNTKRAGRRNLLPPRDPPRFYRLLLGPLCLPSFAVCRSLASHSPVRRSKSSKSSCVARNASTSCGVGLLTICHKAADTLASFQATPVRQASSETTTWCLSVVSASPRCHPIWRTLVRARRTWISWSAWRINPTCERALFTTLLPSRAPRGGAWGMRGMELITPFLAVMCVVLVVLLWREA